MPDNYDDIGDINIWKPLEFKAQIAFEKDYKLLAWNKAGKNKAFVSRYVKGNHPKQAAKNFIWDALDDKEQQAIKIKLLLHQKRKKKLLRSLMNGTRA